VGKNKIKFENIVASELKSCIEKKVKIFFWGEVFFTGEKPFFLELKIPLYIHRGWEQTTFGCTVQ